MLRRLMKSKVHRATITAADLHYEGSLTLDADLMRAADLLPYEEVQVVNVNNGERFVTYLLAGAAGSGTVQLNGAAARLGYPGDLVIIMAFADLDADELAQFEPAVVFVDAQNRIAADPGVPGL
jgi:aspartate 1-decarboxylase